MSAAWRDLTAALEAMLARAGDPGGFAGLVRPLQAPDREPEPERVPVCRYWVSALDRTADGRPVYV